MSLSGGADFHYITAVTHLQIRSQLERNILQREFFDDELGEMVHTTARPESSLLRPALPPLGPQGDRVREIRVQQINQRVRL